MNLKEQIEELRNLTYPLTGDELAEILTEIANKLEELERLLKPLLDIQKGKQ